MNSARCTILYVDADEHGRHAVGPFLARAGEVVAAGSVAEARPIVAAGGFDLLALDVELPDGSGVELMREALAARPWVQTLVLCRAHLAAHTAELIAAGASDVAVKPFDVGTLRLRVERLFRARLRAEEEIRRRQELESRLQHADRIMALGTLCATVVHEVANPVSVVKTNLEMAAGALARTGAPPADLPEILADARTATHVIESFIARLRAFARRDPAGDVETTGVLDRVVEMALLLGRPRAAVARVRVVPPRGQGPVAPHRVTRLAQAVTNALTNAVDATPPGGEVRIGWYDQGAFVGVVVEDDGPGMTPEQQARALEPFYTTKVGGTGLGMGIMRDVLAEHGGSLGVERGARGMRITLAIPRAGRA